MPVDREVPFSESFVGHQKFLLDLCSPESGKGIPLKGSCPIGGWPWSTYCKAVYELIVVEDGGGFAPSTVVLCRQGWRRPASGGVSGITATTGMCCRGVVRTATTTGVCGRGLAGKDADDDRYVRFWAGGDCPGMHCGWERPEQS